MVLLKYLSNFWNAITLEMSLINCEINLILTWSDKFQQKLILNFMFQLHVSTLSTKNNANQVQHQISRTEIRF